MNKAGSSAYEGSFHIHDPCHIANEFIRLGRDEPDPKRFTPLQLQKLVYYAHGWMLGIYHRPLVTGTYEAWRYGPVLPLVYWAFSYNRGEQVKEEVPIHRDDRRDFDEQERYVINAVYRLYGSMEGMALSRGTHVKGTPWHTAGRKREWWIPNERIEAYFAKRMDKSVTVP